METDLLVQGFKEAETKYSLRCGLPGARLMTGGGAAQELG